MTPQPEPRRFRAFVIRWSVFLVGLWVVAVLGMKWFENALVYHPAPSTDWADPGEPPPEDVWLTLDDGTPIHAWYFAHENATGAVLLSHGNGGNLSHRGRLARELARQLGKSVLLYDYPGYGKSGGSPTEAGCYAAGEAGFRWLTQKGFPARNVLLFGESLGGGVAVELASRHDHAALVLVFTFTSLPDAAKFHKPWVPCITLMSNRFDNAAKIGNCRRPVFIAHGTQDGIIPIEQGEALYSAANAPKEFFRMDGIGHNMSGIREELFTALKRFLATNE